SPPTKCLFKQKILTLPPSGRCPGSGSDRPPRGGSLVLKRRGTSCTPPVPLPQVTDSSGHLLYSKDDAKKGKFAFTTEDYEIYEVCFESRAQPGTVRVPDHLITLNIQHGVEARNYEEIAKVEKLKPLELDLRRLEDLSESIVQDFAYMKQREQEMRDTNEATSSRVFYFSTFSMLCLVGLATWQVCYLRRFFKAKKLIE
uniref:GOLD domain-containing protein n=1 Tax=Sphenodon punctatus TaxID=8508 RepID=A0A8D0GWK6_SPHPU